MDSYIIKMIAHGIGEVTKEYIILSFILICWKGNSLESTIFSFLSSRKKTQARSCECALGPETKETDPYLPSLGGLLLLFR